MADLLPRNYRKRAQGHNVRPRLSAFRPTDAPIVASWVTNDLQALWLAPRTPAPITPAAVRGWRGWNVRQYCIRDAEDGPPIAYGELNTLNMLRGHYWLGHLVVASDRRGQGLGRLLTESLLDKAFGELGARRVVLVVFPENLAAIACYRACGLCDEATEIHFLPPYRRDAALLRMAVNVDSWAAKRHTAARERT